MLETDKAQTVDLMKYVLSYASNPTVSLEKTDYSVELVESSVRNLLNELAKVVNMKAGDWICPRYVIFLFASIQSFKVLNQSTAVCLAHKALKPRWLLLLLYAYVAPYLVVYFGL